MLDNKTKERIAANAKKAARTAWEKLPIAAPMICIDPIQKEIQAVLEAEATRAAGLVECLQGIKASCEATGSKHWQRDHVINDILKQVRTGLTNYNNQVNK